MGIFLVLALGLPACAELSGLEPAGVETVARRPGRTMTTAAVASAPAFRVDATRVLSHRIDLREPISVEAAAWDMRLTFAVRRGTAVELTLDPDRLEVRNMKKYPYAVGEMTPHPAHVLATAPLDLEGGAVFSCWTDATSHRVLGLVGPSSDRATPTPISPEGMLVIGEPRVAMAEGGTIVVVFAVATEVGIDLVATSVRPSTVRVSAPTSG